MVILVSCLKIFNNLMMAPFSRANMSSAANSARVDLTAIVVGTFLSLAFLFLVLF